MRKFLTINLALIVAINAYSQQEDSLYIKRLADEVLVNSTAYENLRTLTKQIGGRLAGSPQMYKAEQWGLSILKQNADTAWLQQCMVPHWVRGGKDVAVAFSPGSKNDPGRQLDVLALGNTVGTAGILKADVIEIKSFDELEEKKTSLKGKIVFYNVAFNPTYIRTFQSYAEAVGYRSRGPAKASQYGAKAVIVRSMSHSADNLPHTGNTQFGDSVTKIPAVAIGLKDAEWLSSQLKSSGVQVQLQTHGKFYPDTIGHNVIAELKGSEFPNEFITIGGHLDSWDVAEGAHDDGTGIVQTMEVLRVLKALGYKPKRTLRFVLFANEENGLRGGSKYAEEAKRKSEKHILALESDNGGFTPRGFNLVATASQRAKITAWKSLLSPYGITEFGEGGGADITPLHNALGTPMAEFTPDSQRYFDLHHARNDVFEAVNKRELELGAIAMVALVYLVDKYGI